MYKADIWVNIGIRNVPVFVAGNLRFRLVDNLGVVVVPSVGADVDPATGYISHNAGANLAKVIQRGTKGSFLFTFWRFPDGFSGAVEAFDLTVPAENLGGTAINPQEIENTNVRLSDVLPNVPGGARTWTPTVRDSVTLLPLTGVLLTVRTLAGGIVGQKTTGLDGKVPGNFALPDGNYTYTVNPVAGYNPVAGVPLAIAADTATNIDLVAFALIAPPFESLCSIQDILEYGDGSPAANLIAAVSAIPRPIPQGTAQALLGGEKRTANTDVNGRFTLFLVRGKSYHFEIPLWGVFTEARVPDQANASLRSILGL